MLFEGATCPGHHYKYLHVCQCCTLPLVNVVVIPKLLALLGLVHVIVTSTVLLIAVCSSGNIKP